MKNAADARPSAPFCTQPALREQLRQELLAGDQGGAPGEWNVRKAQLLAEQYRRAGGGYTFAKRRSAPPQPDWLPQDEPTAGTGPGTGYPDGSARHAPRRRSWAGFSLN